MLAQLSCEETKYKREINRSIGTSNLRKGSSADTQSDIEKKKIKKKYEGKLEFIKKMKSYLNEKLEARAAAINKQWFNQQRDDTPVRYIASPTSAPSPELLSGSAPMAASPPQKFARSPLMPLFRPQNFFDSLR